MSAPYKEVRRLEFIDAIPKSMTMLDRTTLQAAGTLLRDGKPTGDDNVDTAIARASVRRGIVGNRPRRA